MNIHWLMEVETTVFDFKISKSFEEWAEEESKIHAGYSEEHIKQMTDPKHNQWGVAGEPKKSGVH